MKITNLTVFTETSFQLSRTLSSIAANVKARKTLTGRQRRRALLVVSNLRLALDDSWSCIPRKGCRAKHSAEALNHLLKEMDEMDSYFRSSYGSKFWKAIGYYLSSKLESVLEDASFSNEKRLNQYGIYWDGGSYYRD